MLIPSVVARPLQGESPTIDLMMGYNKSNTDPLLSGFCLVLTKSLNTFLKKKIYQAPRKGKSVAGHFLDHIDLRVSDLAGARKFYDRWLPALGLSEIVDGDDQRGYTMPGGRKDTPFVWLDALRGHRGGAY